jgi:DHA1 family quinolone resistance protein-like MFS transporter
MISDLVIMTGFGFIDPILAIFFKENIVGGSIATAGIASAIFWVTKSIIQLPFSRWVDAHDHYVWWLMTGSLIIAATPLLYFFAQDIRMVYMAELVLGIGHGIAYPCWLGLWSTHLDKHHESFEWSLYSTLTNLGIAVSAAVGASVAQMFGFRTTFIFVSAVCFLGTLVLLGLEHEYRRMKKVPAAHYHRHHKLGGRRRR